MPKFDDFDLNLKVRNDNAVNNQIVPYVTDTVCTYFTCHDFNVCITRTCILCK